MRRSLAALLCLAAPLFPATFGTVVAPAGGAAYTDLALDESRSNLYLVNSISSRIEIYSLKQKAYLAPISTDFQPIAAALSVDHRFLYVTAYTNAIMDVIDLNLGQLV